MISCLDFHLTTKILDMHALKSQFTPGSLDISLSFLIIFNDLHGSYVWYEGFELIVLLYT